MKSELIKCLFILVLGMLLGATVIARLFPNSRLHNTVCDAVVCDTTTVYDTIPYYKPVPKDSVIKKYITVKLPIAEPQDSVIERQDSIVTKDSVKVQIPISQKVYQDSLYKAYISGYRAELDSIFIYNKETTITIKPKPQRWHIGVGAGYGMTPKGFQPYVGVTFSYSIFSF